MHVLLATDGSEQSLAAARYLRTVMDPSAVDAVTVLAVTRPLAAVPFASDLDDETTAERGPEWESLSFRRAAERATQRVAAEVTGWARSVDTVVASGSPAGLIVETADRLGAGLVVVASRSSGPVDTVLMGSVAHRVLTHAHCPVLVVRGT